MSRITGTIVVLTLVTALAGCASPTLDKSEVEQLVSVVSHDARLGDPSEILYLSNEIKQQLDERIESTWSPSYKFMQLSEFLFEELDIQYDPWHSKTAVETFESRRGNCLSVSSLFVAAARHLGFDGHFETVVVSPGWSREGNTMVRYEHIVASSDVGSKTYIVDLLRSYRDENSSRTNISDEKALALYYSNLAVEALVQDDLDGGLAYLKSAVRLWPDNTSIWSNTGTVYRRLGMMDLAEESYQYALQLDRGNYSALANLTQLYLIDNRDEEADQYMQQVRRYYRRNPFYHIQLAEQQMHRGDKATAIKNLEQAARLQKDDPAVSDALAEIYQALGDQQTSMHQRERAERLRRKQELRKMQEQRFINPAQPGF